TRLRSCCKRTDSACAVSRTVFRSGGPRAYPWQQPEGRQNMVQALESPAIDLNSLRKAIQDEYALVADEPQHGFHFLVGRPLAQLLGYQQDWLAGIPEPTIASFAGTGNPFSVGPLGDGEHVVDVGCG